MREGRAGAAIAYYAIVGGSSSWRNVSRQTWLTSASFDSGAARYCFYVAEGEAEAARVEAHEAADTVAVPNSVLPSRRDSLDPRLALAWGVGGENATAARYLGPKTASSAGRWNFSTRLPAHAPRTHHSNHSPIVCLRQRDSAGQRDAPRTRARTVALPCAARQLVATK